MKYVLILGGLLLSQIGFAQPDAARITDSEILTQYRRLKDDLEDKAITLKSFPNASRADLERIHDSYNKVSKSFDSFISNLEKRIRQSELSGNRLIVGDFDRNTMEQLLSLYKEYEDQFIQKYEEIIGKSPRPGLPADLDERVASCTLSPTQRCRMVIAQNVKTYITTSAKPEKWDNL